MTIEKGQGAVVTETEDIYAGHVIHLSTLPVRSQRIGQTAMIPHLREIPEREYAQGAYMETSELATANICQAVPVKSK